MRNNNKQNENQPIVNPNDILIDFDCLKSASYLALKSSSSPSVRFTIERFFNLCMIAEGLILHEHLLVPQTDLNGVEPPTKDELNAKIKKLEQYKDIIGPELEKLKDKLSQADFIQKETAYSRSSHSKVYKTLLNAGALKPLPEDFLFSPGENSFGDEYEKVRRQFGHGSAFEGGEFLLDSSALDMAIAKAHGVSFLPNSDMLDFMIESEIDRDIIKIVPFLLEAYQVLTKSIIDEGQRLRLYGYPEEVNIPPIMALVLERASKADEIIDVVLEMRNERRLKDLRAGFTEYEAKIRDNGKPLSESLDALNQLESLMKLLSRSYDKRDQIYMLEWQNMVDSLPGFAEQIKLDDNKTKVVDLFIEWIEDQLRKRKTSYLFNMKYKILDMRDYAKLIRKVFGYELTESDIRKMREYSNKIELLQGKCTNKYKTLEPKGSYSYPEFFATLSPREFEKVLPHALAQRFYSFLGEVPNLPQKRITIPSKTSSTYYIDKLKKDKKLLAEFQVKIRKVSDISAILDKMPVLMIDTEQKLAFYKGLLLIHLPHKAFEVLLFLAERPNKTVNATDFKHLWSGSRLTLYPLADYIHKIRLRLGKLAGKKGISQGEITNFLLNEFGEGYKLNVAKKDVWIIP